MMVTPGTDLTPAEQVAVKDLQLARRHARSLERVAWSAVPFGLLMTLVLLVAVAGLWFLLPVPLAIAVWGLLRAQALQLHLAVDRSLLVDHE